MVVGNEHIAIAFGQAGNSVVHIERDQAAFDGPEVLAQARDPGRKESKGQRVRHRKLHHVLPRRGMAAQHGARGLQGLQHFKRLLVERGARSGQARGIRAAVHQVHPRPGFERLDAARKRGLCDVAQLGGAAETAGFSE